MSTSGIKQATKYFTKSSFPLRTGEFVTFILLLLHKSEASSFISSTTPSDWQTSHINIYCKPFIGGCRRKRLYSSKRVWNISSNWGRFSAVIRWRTKLVRDWSANCLSHQAAADNLSGTRGLLTVLMSGQPEIIGEAKSSIILLAGVWWTVLILILRYSLKRSMSPIFWA